MSEGNVFSGSAAGELDASVTTNLGGLPDDWRFLLFLKKLGRHIFFFSFSSGVTSKFRLILNLFFEFWKKKTSLEIMLLVWE